MDDANVDEGPTDAGGKHLGFDGLHVLVGQLDGGLAVGAGEDDAAGNAHVFDTEGGGLVNGVKDGEDAEGIGMDGDGPAELFGVGGRGGVRRAQRGEAGEQGERGEGAQCFHGRDGLKQGSDFAGHGDWD